MRFEHGHYICSESKNKNVSFFKAPVTFRGPGRAGSYDPRRQVAGQRWPKDLQQQKPNLGGMRRL